MLLIYFTPSIHFSCLIFIIVSPRATTKTHIFHMFSFSSTLYLKLLIAFFKKYSFFIWFFFNSQILFHNNSQKPWKWSSVYYVFFLYLVPLCIFRVLLKKKKKKGKKKETYKKKKLEWMQICNCAFLYQSVWLNVGLEWYINNSVDMQHKNRWGGI